MKRKVLVVLLIVFLIFAYVFTSYAASQSELNDYRNKVNNAKNELNNIKGEKNTVANEVKTLSGEIDTLNEELADLNSKLQGLNESIENKQVEIEKKEKEIAEKEELLKERLVAIYENGGTSYLDVLLGSGNYLEMLFSFDVVEQIADADTKLINQVASQKEQIVNEKNELENEKTEVDSVKNQVSAKKNDIQAKKSQKDSIYAQLSESEKSKQQEIDSYNDAISKMEAQLRAMAASAQSKGVAGLHFDGSFIWPCNNKVVTSGMKKRWGRWHKGIDIGANYETVYASASGYAYTAENPGGYGHYIMIFHGGNYVTLYGHLNSYYISSGQYVSQGQAIAQSGNSGSSQGAHLHFEIRQASSFASYFNVSPINPLDYLPGGWTSTAGAFSES